MGFGMNLKRILKEKGLTIKELSEISDVSINTLYSITKRDTEMPTSEIIYKISKALDVETSDLVSYEETIHLIKDNLTSIKQTEITLRNKLNELAEKLNTDGLAELIFSAVNMLEDENDLYRSMFYKNDKI